MKNNSLMKVWIIFATIFMVVSLLGTIALKNSIIDVQHVIDSYTSKTSIRTIRRAKSGSLRSTSDEDKLQNSIILESQNAKPGEIVEVPLILHTNNNCTAYAILIEYDSRLELMETEGAKMSSNFERDGKKFVSLVSYDTKPFIDDENIAVIRFRIFEDAENDKYNVKFHEITTLAGVEGDIENYISCNAYIKVTGGAEKKNGNCLELLDVTGLKGDSAVVQLVSNTNNTCSSYSVLIEYDSRLLLEDKDVVGPNSFYIFDENGKSYVSLVGYVSNNYTDGNLMAALNFHLPNNITSRDCFDVKIVRVDAFSSTYNDIQNYMTYDAIISVAQSSRENDKYSELMTFKKFNKLGEVIASCVGYRGDVNGDGKTNIIDAASIAKAVAGRNFSKFDEISQFFGNANEDSRVDIMDAAMIARYIAKGKVSWDSVMK